MEPITTIVCPVCTLYLRPGITLQGHLASHPKQKVIEALVKHVIPGTDKILHSTTSATSDHSSYHQPPPNQPIQPTWHQPVNIAPPMAPNINQVPANHSFIYQQFMSSSSGTQPILNVNPMAQHFVAVPAVINPQMFCSPYVFHQQQQQLQIVAANPSVQPMVSRQPVGLLNNEVTITPALPNDVFPPKHVDSATSTEPEAPPESKLDNIQEEEENHLEDVDTDNNNEALEVYPDMYAGVENDEVLDGSQISDIIILRNEKSEENHRQTDGINNVEIIENVDISKVEKEIIIENVTEEDINNMPVLISKSRELQWQREEEETDSKGCQTMRPPEYIDLSPERLTPNENKLLKKIEIQDHQIYKVTLPANDIHQVYSLNEEANSIPCSSTVLMPNENVTLLELDDVNFMIANDLMSNDKTILSKVEDYECVKDANGSKILMKIGEEVCMTDREPKENSTKYCDDKLVVEESISHDSLNIHADERMPPRGELSEQESNGASDITWGRLYNEQECSSGMSTSYDLLARESWEASDGSDSEMPPLQSRNPPSPAYILPERDIDMAETVPAKKPIVTKYNCATCGKSFTCPKERRVHQSKEHSHSTSSGSHVTKKIKVRPARKAKTATVTIKEENNFEIFAKPEPTDREDVGEKSSVKVEPVPQEIKEIKQEILCTMCGELYTSLKEYNKHLQKVHKVVNLKHKCKTCLETFPSELRFAEHLKIHPLECNLCGKNFYRKYNLHIHMKRHYNIRPHKCETCGKAFLTKQKLQEHTNVHTGVAPIKCTMCDETFRRHSNLVQHRNKHHFNIKKKYKDFVCHCGEVFHSKNKLSWHKEIHELKPKSCTYCHEKFVHMSSLTRHIRRSHNQSYVPTGKKDAENVECTICKGIYFKSSLEVHMQIHTGNRQHSCLICGKEFTTKWNLKLHKWTHASRTSKPYKCEQCNGAFIRLADFQAHMNSHKSVRPYTCNYCGCKFIRKYNCQRHVREHEINKSYTCNVCNKSFHRSYYLKEHMRVHSGARPFACHICGKTSTTKSNHNKHMKIHHAREPVSTEG